MVEVSVLLLTRRDLVLIQIVRMMWMLRLLRGVHCRMVLRFVLSFIM